MAQTPDLTAVSETEAAPEPISHLAPTPNVQIETTPKPILARGINEYFLPNNLSPEEALAQDGRTLPLNAQLIGLRYHPMLLAQANVKIRNRKYNVDVEVMHTTIQTVTDPNGYVRWQEHLDNSFAYEDIKTRARRPGPI